jgi:hypothetical protein
LLLQMKTRIWYLPVPFESKGALPGRMTSEEGSTVNQIPPCCLDPTARFDSHSIDNVANSRTTEAATIAADQVDLPRAQILSRSRINSCYEPTKPCQQPPSCSRTKRLEKSWTRPQGDSRNRLQLATSGPQWRRKSWRVSRRPWRLPHLEQRNR